MLHDSGIFFGADAIALENENNPEIMYHPSIPDKSLSLKELKQEALLHKVMDKGTLLDRHPSLKEVAAYCQERLSKVPEEHKRFDNPHVYKVGISEKLRDERNQLKTQYKR